MAFDLWINFVYCFVLYHSRVYRVLAVFPGTRRGLWNINLNNVQVFLQCSDVRFFPSIACLSHWFRRKRAIAMGIAYSGSSIGGVIWPILMSHLLNNPNIGFKWAIRIAGFINVSPSTVPP